MVKILGIGKIKNISHNDLKGLYLKLKEKGIFKYPVNNFARFNQDSKLVSLAVALALHDAKVGYGKDKKQNIGIVATKKNAALDAQLDYFKDYLNSGRVIGRGNLFIYTLPTSPLAEAAIHFGLSGPLFYLGFSDNLKDRLIGFAKQMIESAQVKILLVVIFNHKDTTCFVIGKR
ncbi:MAG: hypothetical protein Q8O23_03020 [Gallionella sp.]|nr:hypothetical protein [Gallionella sp.]